VFVKIECEVHRRDRDRDERRARRGAEQLRAMPAARARRRSNANVRHAPANAHESGADAASARPNKTAGMVRQPAPRARGAELAEEVEREVVALRVEVHRDRREHDEVARGEQQKTRSAARAGWGHGDESTF